MNSGLLTETKVFIKSFFKEHGDKRFTFHNLQHTLSVVSNIEKLTSETELTELQIENLLLAAYFHDVGYFLDPANHEEKSSDIATKYLQSKELEPSRISKVSSLIIATKMDYSPTTDFSEKVLRDADSMHLGKKKYRRNSDALRQEWENLHDKTFTEAEWLETNLHFFNTHQFFTDAAKNRGQKRKMKNKAKLENALAEIQKVTSFPNISDSKAAQQQLKTALRNHIDLSAIADNKANIMISVNALIITVGLPILINNIVANKMLLYPTITLALTAVVSMIFATLSTRPIHTKGVTDISKDQLKNSNLFFFGNFYKMPYEKYFDGMTKVVADEELLDSSNTRDLFYLGKSLGTKFDYLRQCYNFFMFGLILTVALFVFTSIFSG